MFSHFVLPPWAKWLALAASIAAAELSIYSYGQQQYKRGESACAVPYLRRANADLATANAKITELQKKYRAQEQAHAQALNAIDTQYQENLSHVKADKDHSIAAVRAGTLRLRDPSPSASERGGGGITLATATAASGSDAATGGELSSQAAEFLLKLTSEADEVTMQLQACQAVVTSDRAQ